MRTLAIFLTVFFISVPVVFAQHHNHRGSDADDLRALSEPAPLDVSCTQATATKTNTINMDGNAFEPKCAKISLSENPIIDCPTFDFAKHNVIILKQGATFANRVISYDVNAENLKWLPSSWTYNFETGEFLKDKNDTEATFSEENIGEGAYNIWCRYHLGFNMVMKLFVTP